MVKGITKSSMEEDQQPLDTVVKQQLSTGAIRRKAIKRTLQRAKRENIRFVQGLKKVSSAPGSMYSSIISKKPEQDCNNDVTLVNATSLGKSRKIKKKLKRLAKLFPEQPDQVFAQIQKFKDHVQMHQTRTLFNSVKQMDQRRKRRLNKMEFNRKKSKQQVKGLQRKSNPNTVALSNGDKAHPKNKK